MSWISLLAPVVAWSTQELGSSYVTSLGCDHLRPAMTRALLLGISLLALVITLAGNAAGYRTFRLLTNGRRVTDEEGRERKEMIALVSALLGTVLTLAVIWGALPALLISNVCEARA